MTVQSNRVVPGLYQHFKGEDKKYFVFGVSTDTVSGEQSVVYVSRYGEHAGKLAVRPLAMFLEVVSGNKDRPDYIGPRFTLIKEVEFRFEEAYLGLAQNTETNDLTVVFVMMTGPDRGKLFNEPAINHKISGESSEVHRTVIDSDKFLYTK